MASQQQPRRWFSLSSFHRPAPPQPPPPRPPAPTQTSQQPVTGPQVLQIKALSPPPTPPQGTTPITSSGPARAPNAASAPRSPVAQTPPSAPPPRSPAAPAVPPPAASAPRSPPAANMTSTLPSAARAAPPSAPEPSSPAAPAPAPLFPARAPTPKAPASRSPPPASQPQKITKSNPTSPIIKTSISLQTSPNKPASPAASTTLCITSSSLSASPTTKVSATNKYIAKNEKGKDVHKMPFGSEKFGKGIITLTGENEGAIMKLNTSCKIGNSNGNEEERSNIKEKSQKIMEMQSQPMKAFINSNVQGVNNSILCNGSFTQNDPGVHISFSRKGNGGPGIHLKDHLTD